MYIRRNGGWNNISSLDVTELGVSIKAWKGRLQLFVDDTANIATNDEGEQISCEREAEKSGHFHSATETVDKTPIREVGERK